MTKITKYTNISIIDKIESKITCQQPTFAALASKKGEACGLLLLYYEILNLLLLFRREVLHFLGCEFHCGVGIGLGAVDIEDDAAVNALYHVEQHLGVGVLLG